MQLFAPADIRSLSHAHNYFLLPPEGHFLQCSKLSPISGEDISSIETSARDQADSQLWATERKLRTTASIFGSICKATERRDMNALVRNIISPPHVQSRALQHGKIYENITVRKYEDTTATKTQECGSFVSKFRPMFAATPDRIVDTDNLLELKCPYSIRDEVPNAATVPFLANTADQTGS